MKLRLAKKLLSFEWCDGVVCCDCRHHYEQREAAQHRVARHTRLKKKGERMSKSFQAAQPAYDAMQPPECYDEDDEQEDGVEELVEIASEEELEDLEE